MTTDLKTQIHDFAAEFASDLPPVDVESIVGGTETDQMISVVPKPKRRWPTWAPAAVAAFLVIVVIGGAAFLFANPEDNDVAEPVTVPTVVEDIAPDPSPPTSVLSDGAEPSATVTGMSWQQVTPNGIDPLADIAPSLISGGDRFVYVHAANAAISTSFDGMNWAKQDIEQSVGDTHEFSAWKDTIVGIGCGGGTSQEEFGPITPLPGCVTVIRPAGTVAIETFNGDIVAAGVGPDGIVISVRNHFDESGLQYGHEDELVARLTGQDITAFAVVEVNDGVLHLESNDGQVSDYVLSDYGYTSIDTQSASGWFSTDGEEWTPISDFPTGLVRHLIGTEEGFFALSGRDAWHSSNGLDWLQLGPVAGDPWTLDRWTSGAMVAGAESVWYLSAQGVEETALVGDDPEVSLRMAASGGFGGVIVDIGDGSAGWELKQILNTSDGQEWTVAELSPELSALDLAWGWYSPVAVATDQAVLLLLFEASDNEYGQAPIWLLGTPTTD